MHTKKKAPIVPGTGYDTLQQLADGRLTVADLFGSQVNRPTFGRNEAEMQFSQSAEEMHSLVPLS
jgi:hypothetical protein